MTNQTPETTTETHHAMHYSDGTWTRAMPFTLTGPADADWHQLMPLNGWECMVDLSKGAMALELEVWCRAGLAGGGSAEPPWYLVSITEPYTVGMPEAVLCDRLPDVMSLLSQWAPVVRDLTLLQVIGDATEAPANLSTVEPLTVLAAHVRHGTGEGYDEIQRKQAERRREAMERRMRARSASKGR